MVTVYTLAGGEMFYQTFNAISALVGSTSWGSLFRIGVTISVCVYVFRFTLKRDPMVFFKWVMVYLFVGIVAIVPKKTVEIVDLTEPLNNRIVNNVPLGLAVISSLTSTIGYGIAQVSDTFFSQSEDQEFTNSGIMFGSNLTRRSLHLPVTSSEYQTKVVDYITSCVIGDILINRKYTIGDLLNSTDILGLITANPSPVRMVNFDGKFITCKNASSNLLSYNANYNESYLKSALDWVVSPFIANNTSGVSYNKVSSKELLTNTYGYMFGASKSANDILNQNTMISLTSKGLRGLASINDDVGSLVTIAKEESQMKTRLNWGVTAQVATSYLPIIHTVLTLLLIGFFPIIIVLTLTDLMGLNPLKMYAYSFIYLLSWMPLFSILSNIMTFYTKTKLGHYGVPTLSNVNQIDLTLSDIGMVAGFMSMSIPYLAHMITRGVMGATYQAYGSIMGSINSDNAQASTAVATGNYNRGNISFDNVNGNKWDTSITNFRNTSRSDDSFGGSSIDTTSGLGYYSARTSNLGSSVSMGKQYAEKINESMTMTESKLSSMGEQIQQTASSAFKETQDLLHNRSNSSNLSDSTDNSISIARNNAINKADSIAENYSKQHSLSKADSEKLLFSAGLGFKNPIINIGASGSAELSRTDTNTEYDSNTLNMAKEYRTAIEEASRLSQQESGSHSNGYSDTYGNRLSSDYSKLDSLSKNWNETQSIQRNLGRELAFAQSNDAGINTSLNNQFLEYVKAQHPSDWQQVISDQSHINEKHQLAQDFLQHRVDNLSGAFESDKKSLDNQFSINKQQYTHNGVVDLKEMTNYYNKKISDYVQNNTGIKSDDEINNDINKLFNQYKIEREKSLQEINSSKGDIKLDAEKPQLYKENVTIYPSYSGYAPYIDVKYEKWDGKSQESHLFVKVGDKFVETKDSDLRKMQAMDKVSK